MSPSGRRSIHSHSAKITGSMIGSSLLISDAKRQPSRPERPASNERDRREHREQRRQERRSAADPDERRADAVKIEDPQAGAEHAGNRRQAERRSQPDEPDHDREGHRQIRHRIASGAHAKQQLVDPERQGHDRPIKSGSAFDEQRPRAPRGCRCG